MNRNLKQVSKHFHTNNFIIIMAIWSERKIIRSHEPTSHKNKQDNRDGFEVLSI